MPTHRVVRAERPMLPTPMSAEVRSPRRPREKASSSHPSSGNRKVRYREAHPRISLTVSTFRVW